MPRLRRLSGKQIVKILTEAGFTHVGGRGSHVVMQRQIAADSFTVVVPMHREVRTGTLASIIRQSGLPRSLFETR